MNLLSKYFTKIQIHFPEMNSLPYKKRYKKQQVNTRLVERPLSMERIEKQWEIFLDSLESQNIDDAISHINDIVHLFYKKSQAYIDLADELGMPLFICDAAKEEENDYILKPALVLALNLIVNGSSSVFQFFLENDFFNSINDLLNSDRYILFDHIIAIMTCVLKDFVNIGQSIPFDLSPKRLNFLIQNLDSYGPVFMLIGNVLCEISEFLEVNEIEEYINLAFSILNTEKENVNIASTGKFFCVLDVIEHFFNQLVVLIQKNSEIFWPIIKPYLPYINSLINIKNEELNDTRIEQNTHVALKTLCNLIKLPSIKKEVISELPFQDLIEISSKSHGENKYMSMKLLSKTLNDHISELSNVFDSEAFENLPFFFEEGEFLEKEGCLCLTKRLIILSGEDIRLSDFYDAEFLSILINFVDIEHVDRAKNALRIIYLILSYKNELIEEFYDEYANSILQEARFNSEDKKIIKYSDLILQLANLDKDD